MSHRKNVLLALALVSTAGHALGCYSAAPRGPAYPDTAQPVAQPIATPAPATAPATADPFESEAVAPATADPFEPEAAAPAPAPPADPFAGEAAIAAPSPAGQAVAEPPAEEAIAPAPAPAVQPEPNVVTMHIAADPRVLQRMQMAQQMMAAGRYREALRLLASARTRQPNPALLFNMAICLEHLGELARAARLYQQVVTDPVLGARASRRVELLRRMPARQMTPARMMR